MASESVNGGDTHTHKNTGKQPHLETAMNEGKERASQLISVQNFKVFSLL